VTNTFDSRVAEPEIVIERDIIGVILCYEERQSLFNLSALTDLPARPGHRLPRDLRPVSAPTSPRCERSVDLVTWC